MVIYGRDLIVTANGMAIAAAKSCELQVSCDDIEISSPNSGQWREFITDRKEWAVRTNHLVVNNHAYDCIVTAFAMAHTGKDWPDKLSYGTVNGSVLTTTGMNRGLNVWLIDKSTYQQVGNLENFDTHGDLSGESARLVTYLDGLSGDYIVVIVSHDAFGMSSELQTKLNTLLGWPTSVLSNCTTSERMAFAGIGDTATHKGTAGLMIGVGATAKAKLLLANGAPVTTTPLRDAVARIGQTYTLQMSVDGLADDVLTGTAICKQFKVTGSLGNLAQGSFSWKGSGALI